MPPALHLLLQLLVLAIYSGVEPPPGSLETDRAFQIERRKEALVSQLADCESPHGAVANGRYVGRFQFDLRTVIAFVKQRDGRTITEREAVTIAADYGQASALVKYIVFERDGAAHWPACGRKIGLSRQVAEIRAL